MEIYIYLTDKYNLRKGDKIVEQKAYKLNSSNDTNMLPGNLQRLPDESFFDKILVFIDANFLSKLSNYFGNGKYLVYDIIKFPELIPNKQKAKLEKIFYYTAPPFLSPRPTREEEKKEAGYKRFTNKLKKQGVIVREGRCQRLKIDGNYIFKQKAVDILVAMDLSSVPLDFPHIKRIILISSDSDFVPVVKKLDGKGVKTILYTYYEKKRDTPFSRSNYLIKSVYKYKLLTKEDFEKAKLEKEVKK
jgi:uncharacterized LabA/DUF88 family protein